MLRRRVIGSGMVLLARILAAGTATGSVAAQNTDENEKKRERNIELGLADAKQLLLLMDKDKNGKVSKQEFMSFMDAEFDRLDVNKDGELDVKELTKTRVRIGGAIHR